MEHFAAFQAQDERQPHIPIEIWGIVISQPCLSSKDLKNVRLVSTAFKDFATPIVFDHVTVSVIPESMDNLKKIAISTHLAALVKTLHLDSTLFVPRPSIYHYCASASRRFGILLGDQTSGPLSVHRLQNMISYPPCSPLPPRYLTGPLRSAFLYGFTLHHARSEFARAWAADGRMLRYFTRVLPPFKNVSSIKLHQEWTPAMSLEEQRRIFKAYLIQNLPAASLERIPGLMANDEPRDTSLVPAKFSFFDGPGVAARDMNPMWLPPQYPPRPHMHEAGFPLSNLLRALRSTEIQIRNLQLPGRLAIDADATGLGQPNYERYIHVTSLGGDMFAGAPANDVLVHPFSQLRDLDIHIDPIVYSGRGITYPSRPAFFSKGIQAMHKIERLQLEIRTKHREDAGNDPGIITESWSVGTIFLRGLLRAASDNGPDDGPDDGDSDEAPPDALFQARPPNHVTVLVSAMLGIYTQNDPRPQPLPDYFDALPNNPWPGLRSLSLAGVTASFSDFSVLFKTIAPSLRRLTLWDVRLLGSCRSCHQGGRFRAEHAGDEHCWDYIDVAVMLVNVLALETCRVSLWDEDIQAIAARMEWSAPEGNGTTQNVPMRTVVKEKVDDVMGKWLQREQGIETWELLDLLERTAKFPQRGDGM